MRNETRRSQLDHERYLRNRDERLRKQKEYYQSHKELYSNRYRAQRFEAQSIERLYGLERHFQNEHIGVNVLNNVGGVTATKGDYQDVDILPGSVVYCDIPYKGTHGYRINKKKFDHERFYEWCLSREYPVFVSEYKMPSEFKPIASKIRIGSMSRNNGEIREERLYVQARYADKYKRDFFI